MKKLLLTAVFLFTAFTSFAQINFEPGFIIDNSGNQTPVLIRNVEWRNNPSVIDYKTSEASEVRSALVSDIQGFGIGEDVRYVRHPVQVDQSSDNIKSLSRNRNPEFKEETVLLKMLIDGQADLYQFNDESKSRFFYAVNDAPVEQLVYKQYQTGTGTRRGRNNQFRQELLNNLTCSELGPKDLERLNYSESDLRSYFVKYHECLNAEYVIYGTPTAGQKDGFNLKIKAGLNHAPLEIERVGSMFTIGQQIEFDMDPSFRLGLEAEYVLPFNKNKWALFIEPIYQQVKGEKSINYISYNPDKITTVKVNYNVISVPLGVRHYFFLNDDSRIFVNGAYVFNYYFNSSISDSEKVYFHEMGIRNNSHTAEIGAGYSFKNKIGLELRYGLPREIFADHTSTSQFPTHADWQAVNHSFVSLILGYTIF